MIFDGAAQASGLPPSHAVLMEDYVDGLREAAIDAQREHGLPLAELLGVILVADAETVGVGATAELAGELRATLDAENRRRLDAFLAGPLPATHMRFVIWNSDGVSLMRMDTVLPARGGVA